MINESIVKAAEKINEAEALVITAGAGMGVDSGLPDFRGNQGFWKAYPPYADKGLSFIEMANPHWFHSDPEFAWGFYGHRLNLYRTTTPHRGYMLLKEWGEQMKHGIYVYTSNVDGQFQKAGYPEDRINEVHGSIHHLQCTKTCGIGIFSASNVNVEIDEETMRAIPPLPACPSCGALARPNILMFGDWEYDGYRQYQQADSFRIWIDTVFDAKLIVVECGAGTAVPTVRMTSERLVQRSDAILIRINIREPQVRSDNISLAKPALETLLAINEVLQREH